ncbi:MAG: hypothetical protein ACLRMZ_12360 [Blautia marasmi]
MKSGLTVKKTHLLCAITLLLTLFSGQSSKLFGISGGAAYQLLYYLKYISALFLVAYALYRKRKVPDYGEKVIENSFSSCSDDSSRMFCCFYKSSPGNVWNKILTRSVAVFLDRFCIYAVVIGIWELCGDKAIDCITNTFIVDELLVIVSAIYMWEFQELSRAF